MRNKIAWGIAIGSSIPQGIVIAWTAMMVINLTQVLFVSENEKCEYEWRGRYFGS